MFGLSVAEVVFVEQIFPSLTGLYFWCALNHVSFKSRQATDRCLVFASAKISIDWIFCLHPTNFPNLTLFTNAWHWYHLHSAEQSHANITRLVSDNAVVNASV